MRPMQVGLSAIPSRFSSQDHRYFTQPPTRRGLSNSRKGVYVPSGCACCTWQHLPASCIRHEADHEWGLAAEKQET